MKTQRICQSCQAPLAADAPQGLCPACLMKAALVTGTVAGEGRASFTPPTLQELAPKFPQLELIELIGRGGMGAVYKARQKQLDRIVALKILPPGIGTDSAFAERFAREAKALAKLNHPGIITIHDFGCAEGLYFFVMEFVDGVNLRQLLNAGRVSAREALAIVPQICDALQFAHDQGIVHRDIKPENILLDRRGRVKVADFGLAKIVEGPETVSGPTSRQDSAPTANLTEAARVMGTPQYMSPEQVQAPGEVDHRADIYALGVVLYQMLTGELPGKSIEPPSKRVQVDVRLDEVVLRALEKKPELRYQQASVLKTDLETIASAPVAAAVPTTLADARPRAVVGVASVLLFGGIWSFAEMLLGSNASGHDVRILPGVFLVPLGIALLRLREIPRRVAVWSMVVAAFWLLVMIGWVFGKAFGAFEHTRAVVRVLGQPMNSGAGGLLTFLFLAVQAILVPWMYFVLVRPGVRAAFALPVPRPRPYLEWGLTVLAALLMLTGIRLPLQNPIPTGVMIEQRPPAPASAEGWKPETAPNGKVDLNKVRDEIQARMNAQDYEGALQRQIWYFNHALEHGEVDAVRLSFGIMHWGELGRRYPKARQALVEIRNQRAAEFDRGGGHSGLFSEVQNINRELSEPSATLTLFRSIEGRDPQLARQCYPYAESVLVDQGDYSTCVKYLGDSQARFAFLKEVRERTLAMLDRVPSSNPAPMRKQANDTFVNECRKLVEILVGVGRTPEAQALADQAIVVLNDPRLQSAVADAEARVRERRSNPGA